MKIAAGLAPFESLAILYFLALACASFLAVVSLGRRLLVALLAVVAALLVWATSTIGGDILRASLPHVYLIVGYWLPGLLTPRLAHATRFEQWLVASDARVRPRLPGMTSALTHITELAYLLCYPLVPLAFAIVWVQGTMADVTRFWVAVLSAGYASYVSLPWLVSRPPRLLAHVPSMRTDLGAVNVFVLGKVSHQLNTFPSGHVAVSLAAAAMVGTVSATAGAALGVASIAIAIGAGAGRYHYVVDVVLGVGAAAAAVLAALTV